jgi:hypothetical protein
MTIPSGSPAAQTMSTRVTYSLEGPGISVRYSDDELVLDGDTHLLQKKFGADSDAITTSTSELGISVQAVLLLSSRNGTRFTLSLLLPQVDLPVGAPAREITGAAVIVRQFQDVVDGPPSVLQAYEIRPLRGSVSATS